MRPVIALAFALAGCSLVNDPGDHRGGTAPGVDAGAADAGPQPIAPADLCTELVRLLCEARLECCDDPGQTYEECRTNAMTDCQMLVGPFLEDERTGYTPMRAGELIAEGRRIYRDSCSLEILDFLGTKERLLSMFDGTVPLNGSCSILEVPTLLSCERPELVCQPMGFGTQCLPVRTEGEPCAFDLACETGLYCPSGMGATCAPQLADGAGPCAEGPDCQSYICNTTTMLCEPRTADVYCLDPFSAFRGMRDG